jgi:hypothetical protein
MPSITDDPAFPAYWRTRAQEARTLADQMTDPEAKRTILDIAIKYDLLAQRAERRNKKQAQRKLGGG